MISVSTEAAAELAKSSRQFSARFLKAANNVIISGDIRSLSVHKGSCGESQFVTGTAYVPYIDATISGTTEKLEGVELKLQFGIKVNGDVLWYDIGYFTVIKPETSAYQTSFTAVGRLNVKFEKMYASSLSYPATVGAVIDEIATKTGTTILYSGITVSGSWTKKIEGMNCREALQYIAGALFCYVTEDTVGRIVIKKYSSTKTFSTNGNRMTALPTFADNKVVINGVKCIVSSGSDGSGDVPQEVYYSHGTPNLVVQNEFETQALFNSSYGNIVGFTYNSGTINMALGDFRLEPWDVVECTDIKGNAFVTPCMSIVHTFDGGIGTDIVAPLVSTMQDSDTYKGAITRAIERYSVKMVAAEKLIAEKADIVDLNVTNANVTNLSADVVEMGTAVAGKLDVSDLAAETAKLGYADVDTMKAEIAKVGYITADEASLEYATIGSLNATDGRVQTLESTTIKATDITSEGGTFDYLRAQSLNAHYAAIDLGNITELSVSDKLWVKDLLVQGKIIAQDDSQIYYLTSIHINANDITAGQLSADKLVLMGEDGIYYQLNVNALGETSAKAYENYFLTSDQTVMPNKTYYTYDSTTETYSKVENPTTEEIGTYYELDNTLYRTIHASNITANSITVEKITAENLQGTNGWINLRDGTFQYFNAINTSGIAWDGENLDIRGGVSIGSLTNELKNVIDSKAQVYNGHNKPTLLNYPANEWIIQEDLSYQGEALEYNDETLSTVVFTNTDVLDSHINELYIVDIDNEEYREHIYRFTKYNNGTYGWEVVSGQTAQDAWVKANNLEGGYKSLDEEFDRFRNVLPDDNKSLKLSQYLKVNQDGLFIGAVNTNTGLPDNFYTNFRNNAINFMDTNSEEPIAYIRTGDIQSELSITNAEIRKNINMGTEEVGWYSWIPRKNGHLSLKWIAPTKGGN